MADGEITNASAFSVFPLELKAKYNEPIRKAETTLDAIRTYEPDYAKSKEIDIGRYAADLALGGIAAKGLQTGPFGLGTSSVLLYAHRLSTTGTDLHAVQVVFYLLNASDPGVLEEFIESAKRGV